MVRLPVLLTVIMLTATTAKAATWIECNGVPVHPKTLPLPFAVNGCSVTDLGNSVGRSVINGLNELDEYTRMGKFGFTTPRSECSITHNDGRSDVALVDPKFIDGNPGRTLWFDTPCTWAWDERLRVESDVMVSGLLDFGETDESFAFTSQSDR